MSTTLDQQTSRRIGTATSATTSATERARGQVLLFVGVVLIAANLRLVVGGTGPLLTWLESSLHLSSWEASLLTTLWPLGFALAGVFGPALARRFGVGTALTGSVVVIGLGSALRSAPTGVALLIGSLLAAVGIGIANVLLPVATRRYFPDRIGVVTSVYGTALGVGSALAALIAVPVARGIGSPSTGMVIWVPVALLALIVWLATAPTRRALAANADPANADPANADPANAGAANAGAANAGAGSAGPGSAGAGSAGLANAGPEAAGTGAAGTATTGLEHAGLVAVGTGAMGTGAVGAGAVGLEHAGLGAADSEAVRPEAVRPENAGAGAVAHVPLAAMLHDRLAWAMAALFGLQSMLAYVIMGWLPDMLQSDGMTESNAGLVLSVALFVGIPLTLTLPALVTRLHDRRPLVMGLTGLMVLGFVGLLVAPVSLAYVWAVILGAGMAVFPVVLALIGVLGGSHGGTAALSAFAQSIGYVVAAGAPLGFGLLHDATGAWTISLSGMVVTASLLTLVGGYVASPRRTPIGGDGR